ncbi:MAG TPA: translesion error-prone DNA polymerase V autoproteolytic subunit [Candidatus Desulfobacillus sp.]|nr:translesion error-prone DNA polymerase V autoproteolytic subunit [Candidatus Desulfobacillus sp.]
MIPIPFFSARRLPRPLLLSRVPAGFPSPADDYVEGSLDLNEHLVAHREATFFLRVQGHSMSGAGIADGDLLVVDRALEAGHGDIVVAVVDGELTVKRLWRRGARVRLVAENPAYAPIELKDGQELAVWGVVTAIVRRVR